MEGQDKVLFDALEAWVERRVQASLPPGKRGLRARDPIRRRLGRSLETTLLDIAERVTQEVELELPATPGSRRAEAVETLGRHKVLDNAEPCDGCGRTTLLAVVDLEHGVPTVECENCAPEFREGR